MRPLNEIRNYMGSYHVKSGVYHYYRNEFQQALGFLRKALSEEQSLSDGERSNARCYLALSLKGQGQKQAAAGELDEGLQQLRAAAEVQPDFPDIHFLTARLLERMERADDAIASYRRAIDCHPDYLDAHVALGFCLARAERHDEAAAAFERAFQVKLASMREPFAEALTRLGGSETEGALERMHEVFLAAPNLADVYLARGLEYLRAEQWERALDELDRALEHNPRYPDLHNFRGLALCELDRPLEAADAFRRSAELAPGQVVPRLNLAFCRLRAGQPAEAEIELESVLAGRPEDPVASAKLDELRQHDRRGAAARPGGAQARS